MKSKAKRLVALFLLVLMCFNVAACTNAPKWEGKWEITDDEYKNALYLDSESEVKDGTRTVTITSEYSDFKPEISKESVRITALPFTKEEIYSALAELNAEVEESTEKATEAQTSASSDAAQAEEKGNYLQEREIILTDYTVERKDEKTLILSFKEQDFEYICVYNFYVHKEAVEKNVFAIGGDIGGDIVAKYKNPASAELINKLTNGEENPTLEIKLTNAQPAKDIKKEDITLSGVLKDLQVSSVSASDDTVKIETTGTVYSVSSPYAYVDFSADATDYDDKITASAEICQLNACIDFTSYTYENGVLSFDVYIVDDKLELSDKELAPLVKLEGFTVEKTEISKEKDYFKLFAKSDAKDIDDAVSKINGAMLTIDENAVGGNGIEFKVSAAPASLLMEVKSVDKPEDGSNIYKATAELYPEGGIIKDLQKSDITFDGDFVNAEITSVEESDYGYKIEFSFVCNNEDQTSFSSFAYLAEGKLISFWGTPSKNLSTHVSFAFDDGKGDDDTRKKISETIGAIKDIIDMFDGEVAEELSMIANITQKVFNIGTAAYSLNLADAVKNTQALLSILGLYDNRSSEEKKLDEIYSMVEDTKAMVQSIDTKLSELQKSVSASTSEIIAGVNKTTLLAACNGWRNFRANYIDPLQQIVNTYNNNVRANLVNYVRSAHGDKLTVYYDKNNKLAIPDKISPKYSVDGEIINKSKTVEIELDDDSFAQTEKLLKKNNWSYCKDFSATLKDDLLKVLEKNKNSALKATKANATVLYNYILANASFEEMTKDIMNSIENKYVAFCNALSGDSTGSPLDSFYQVMYSTYNFQNEAKVSIENMRDYLYGLVFKYATVASYAAKYNTGYDSVNMPVEKASKKVIAFLSDKKNSGLHEEPKGYIWCYVLDKPITINRSSVFSCVEIDGTGHPEIQWKYDDYTSWFHLFDCNLNNLDISDLHVKSCKKLSGANMSIIKARFEKMGLVGKMSFQDYLASCFNVEVGKISKVIISDTTPKRKDFPVDGTRTLTCTQGYGKSFKKGANYKIGPDDKKYYRVHLEITASTFNLNSGDITADEVLAEQAVYAESFWGWYIDKVGVFEEGQDGEYLYFPIY